MIKIKIKLTLITCLTFVSIIITSGCMFSGSLNRAINELKEESNINSSDSQQSKSSSVAAISESDKEDSEVQITQTPKPETIEFEIELLSGNYISGIDFPPGKYNIQAIKGGGNVISDNWINGGINSIMGTEEMNEVVDIYQETYNNINLPKGTRINFSGLTVKISSKNALNIPLEPRNQKITESFELTNGYYIAGEDFPSGIYDIKAIKGGGNINSDNWEDGGLNAIMGIDSLNKELGLYFYTEEYKNIPLTDGVEISISGLTVLMTPSK